jgi:hypothetical protein
MALLLVLGSPARVSRIERMRNHSFLKRSFANAEGASSEALRVQ